MNTRMLSYRSVILIILALAAGGIFFTLQQKKGHRGSFALNQLEIGKPAPDFSFPGLTGNMVRLSDYRGKVVLVNVWATWCQPCVAEMPSMEKLYRQLKGEKFEILAVSIDSPGAAAVEPFLKQINLSFPILIDSQGSIKTAYNLSGVPESFIINRQGNLAQKIVGPLDWAAPEVLKYFRGIIESD
jgi:peroxiredoxin